MIGAIKRQDDSIHAKILSKSITFFNLKFRFKKKN